MRPIRPLLIILWLTFTAANLLATDITFFGSSGDRQASVQFSMSPSGELMITLRNVSPADAWEPTDMLAGVFFDVADNPVLTPEWARLDADACFLYPTDPGCPSTPASVVAGSVAGGNIGGEWAYRHYNAGSPIPSISQNSGIGAVGFGYFGVEDRFDTSQNISGPDGIDGINFSLAPAGDVWSTGNGGILGDTHEPFIWFGARFAFLLPIGSSFNPATAISNVRFQYGTAFDEPAVFGDPVPEPAAVALIGGGLLALGLLRRRFGG